MGLDPCANVPLVQQRSQYSQNTGSMDWQEVVQLHDGVGLTEIPDIIFIRSKAWTRK